MKEVLIIIMMISGSIFILLAGIGILRMPDVLLRLSATTKAATLGVGSMLFAFALYYDDIGITARAIATIIFVFLTAPVAAHMIGRSSYYTDVKLWDSTHVDELTGKYEKNKEEMIEAKKKTR
jgi:multicomponent Na+:H+ antiporter subunit G